MINQDLLNLQVPSEPTPPHGTKPRRNERRTSFSEDNIIVPPGGEDSQIRNCLPDEERIGTEYKLNDQDEGVILRSEDQIPSESDLSNSYLVQKKRNRNLSSQKPQGETQQHHLQLPKHLQQQLETIASHHSQESPNIAAKQENSQFKTTYRGEAPEYSALKSETHQEQVTQPQKNSSTLPLHPEIKQNYKSCQDLRKLESTTSIRNFSNQNFNHSQISQQSSSLNQNQLLSFQSAYLQNYQTSEGQLVDTFPSGSELQSPSNQALLSQYMSLQQVPLIMPAGRNLLQNNSNKPLSFTSQPNLLKQGRINQIASNGARLMLFSPQSNESRINPFSPISIQQSFSNMPNQLQLQQPRIQNQNHLLPQIGGLKKKLRRPQLQSKFIELTANSMPFNQRKVSTASNQLGSSTLGQGAQSVRPLQSQPNQLSDQQLLMTQSQSVRNIMPQSAQAYSNSHQNGDLNSQPPSVMNPLKFQVLNCNQHSTRDLQSVLSRESMRKGSDQSKEAIHNFQKFVVNQQSQFYNSQMMSNGPSIQQTYQMFMPNKIKRGKDLKQNHNILKRTANANKQGNQVSFAPAKAGVKPKQQSQQEELQQVLRNITPLSVQQAEKQIKQFQIQRELNSNDLEVKEDDMMGQVHQSAGTQMTASSPLKLSAQERQILNFDTMTQNGGGAPSDSSPQKLDTHYAQLSISQNNLTNIQIERVIMQTEQEVFIDDYNKKLGGAIQIKSLGGTNQNIKQSNLQGFSFGEGSPEQEWKQQLLITNNSTPFKESNQTIDQQVQYSTRYTHTSRKSAHGGKDQLLSDHVSGPIKIMKEQSAPQLFIGKQGLLKPKNQCKQPTSTDQNQIITSPYGDASLSSMVYLGGFLLKPRSKMATFQEIKNRQLLKQTQEDETLSNFKEGKESGTGEKLIQVKSLEKAIKLRQQYQKQREMTRSGSRQQRLRDYQWPPAGQRLNSDLEDVEGQGAFTFQGSKEESRIQEGELRRVGSAGAFTKKRGSNQSQAHNDSLYKHLHQQIGSDSKLHLEPHNSGNSHHKPLSNTSHYLHDLESPHSYRPVQKVLITHKESATQFDEGQAIPVTHSVLTKSKLSQLQSTKGSKQESIVDKPGDFQVNGLNVTGKRSVAFQSKIKGEGSQLGSRNLNKLPLDSKKEVRSYDNTTATKTSQQMKPISNLDQIQRAKLKRQQTNSENTIPIEGVNGQGLGILKNFQHILNKDLVSLQAEGNQVAEEHREDTETGGLHLNDASADQSEIEEPDDSQFFQAPQWNESPMLSTRTIKMMKAIHEQKQELQVKSKLSNNQKEQFYRMFSQEGAGRTISNSSLLKYHSINAQLDKPNIEGATSSTQVNPSVVVMQSLYFKEKDSVTASNAAQNGGSAGSNNPNLNSRRLTSKLSRPLQTGEETSPNKNAEQLTGW